MCNSLKANDLRMRKKTKKKLGVPFGSVSLLAMQKLRVYYNLHKHCLSVQGKVNGTWKVIAHVDEISLSDVKFKVSEAGRQRVIREKRKNVHAIVEGFLNEKTLDCSHVVSYNPYKAGHFYERTTLAPIYTATHCQIKGKQILIP
jgi:hypothetical protein